MKLFCVNCPSIWIQAAHESIQNISIRMNCRKPEKANETPEALLNDIVLQTIFKYLGYQDLKSSRQVGNTTWLKNSKKAWWSRTKVTFRHAFKSVEDRYSDYLSENGIMSNATNYTFAYLGESSKRLLNLFEDSIKYLEIELWELASVDDFRHIIYKRCPNVEKVVVHELKFDIDIQDGIVEPLDWVQPQFRENKNLKSVELNGYIPVSWMEFLSHLPNLQSLKAPARDDGIFKAISIIRQHDPKMLNLNHVDIYGLGWHDNDYDQSFRLVYLDPNLSLQKLGIQFHSCQDETLDNVLELHANDLEELCVYGHELIPRNASLRQPLKILEKLTISNCRFTVDIFMYTPNVRKVDLHYIGPRYNLFQKEFPKQTISTCTELKLILTGIGQKLNSDLTFFLDVFPNVEVFQTSDLNNLEFSMICERWTKLRSFDVCWGSVDVTGLLGYDPDSNPSNRIRKPNITDLKGLQSFSMILNGKYFPRRRDPTEMKHDSVIQKELKALQHLKKFQFENYEGNVTYGNQLFHYLVVLLCALIFMYKL